MSALFGGEHYFKIENLDNDTRVRFVQGENFKGILVPFMGSMLKDTEAGFRLMNQALKSRAETAS